MDATAAGAALAKDCGLVMLYHAVFERPPDALAGGLHNVRPSALRAQLEAVGRHFEFVDADTIAALPDPRGHAAVTFDDGYRSVFDSALPVLESLGIPFTVYLNGAAFDGAAFWRDKVRLVQAMGWVSEFESFMRGSCRLPAGGSTATARTRPSTARGSTPSSTDSSSSRAQRPRTSTGACPAPRICRATRSSPTATTAITTTSCRHWTPGASWRRSAPRTRCWRGSAAAASADCSRCRSATLPT
ncbi:MAG: polysaccharide deacetylase family protein [Gammaproteobacteria bacterium]|nr:polysaccharide deacetylase family protein [Gammaproteobacteria bacterium]